MPRFGTRQLDIRDQNAAVGDHLIVGRGIGYQQRLAAELAAAGADADPGAWYLERSQMVMVWPYDDQCRLIGEDRWEFDHAEHALIKPLPPFDASLLPR